MRHALLIHYREPGEGELTDEVVAEAKRLHRASPKTGERRSLRKIRSPRSWSSTEAKRTGFVSSLNAEAQRTQRAQR